MRLLPLLPFVLAAIYLCWNIVRTRAMVAAWAELNGCKMLEWRRSWVPPLNLWVTSSRSQVIVSIRVYDETTHRIRSGWLRLGSFWWGLLDADAIEVQWQDPQASLVH